MVHRESLYYQNFALCPKCLQKSIYAVLSVARGALVLNLFNTILLVRENVLAVTLRVVSRARLREGLQRFS